MHQEGTRIATREAALAELGKKLMEKANAMLEHEERLERVINRRVGASRVGAKADRGE